MRDTTPTAPRLRATVRRRGFTLVEVTMSLAVVAVALGLLVSSMLALTHARRQSNERNEVATVMSRALETLESLGPTGAFAAYAPAPDGAPFPAAGAGAGEPFSIAALQAPDGGGPATVEIEFIVDETELDATLGLPRDLDGDGEIGNPNVTQLGEDGEVLATMLPVRLRASWRGFSGQPRSLTWSAMIVRN